MKGEGAKIPVTTELPRRGGLRILAPVIPQDSTASDEELISDPVAAAAPAAAPSAVAGAAAEAKAQLRSEAASADGMGRESSRARMQAAPAPAPQLAGAIRAYVNLPPEKWLEQIEELRKQGKLEEAKTSLAEFKKRYPEYPLPASLKDGIKP